MTQKDKELLLVDLCAKLPYGGMVEVQHELGKLTSIDIDDNDEVIIYSGDCDEDAEIEYCKFYLRPMSSMTEDEYNSVSWGGCSHTYNYSSKSGFQFVEIKTFTLNMLNWLNAHHFDYRGLIEKGLALEATEGMYKMEEQQ